MRITSKSQMYNLLRRGVFGNTVRHWESFAAMMTDDYSGDVGARLHAVGRPWRMYRVPKAELAAEVRRLGWEDRRDVEYYESPPDDHRVIQGELAREPGGLYFRHTFAPGPMRTALESEELHAIGLEAEMLIRRCVSPGGRDWLMDLLDQYDGAVVEFTEYRHNVGVFCQPTLIWEVRHY